MPGKNGFGTELQLEIASVMTPIANMTSVSGPEISNDTTDVTAHDSPNRWREFIATLLDGGEVSADLNYDPGETTHQTLFDLIVAGDPVAMRVVFPEGDYFYADVIPSNLGPESPHDDKMTCSVTLKVTGEVGFEEA